MVSHRTTLLRPNPWVGSSALFECRCACFGFVVFHLMVTFQDDVEVRCGGTAAADVGPQVLRDAQAHRRGSDDEDGVGRVRSLFICSPIFFLVFHATRLTGCGVDDFSCGKVVVVAVVGSHEALIVDLFAGFVCCVRFCHVAGLDSAAGKVQDDRGALFAGFDTVSGPNHYRCMHQ